MVEEVKYDAQELIRLTNRREQVLQQLIALAEPLPEYKILLSILVSQKQRLQALLAN